MLYDVDSSTSLNVSFNHFHLVPALAPPSASQMLSIAPVFALPDKTDCNKLTIKIGIDDPVTGSGSFIPETYQVYSG